MRGSKLSVHESFRQMAELIAKMAPWWLLLGCIIVSWVSAFYMVVIRGYNSPMVASCQPQSWWRLLWIIEYPGGALMAAGLLAFRPPSLSPLARKMIAIIIFVLAAQTAVSALALWLGTDQTNLADLGIRSVALLASLAFVLWRKFGHA
ncbi:MAG: hypothetical protein ACLQVG_13080 [Terriglobia bacterium]